MEHSSLLNSPVFGLKADWIDFNGHLNMAYYMVLFDKALDWHFDQFGMGPDYITRRGHSGFAVEAKISYLKELLLGDEVYATMRVMDLSDKALHYISDMYRVSDGALICVLEAVTLHIDMNIRKTSLFPDDIMQALKTRLTAHALLAPSPYVGKPVGIKRK